MLNTSILIVEDERATATYLQEFLESQGFVVPGVAFSGEMALEMTEKLQPDLILMDIMLEGEMDGIETTIKIRKNWNIPIIYLTAHDDDALSNRAIETNPYGYILKPFNANEIKINIALALKKKLDELLAKSEKRFQDIVELLPGAVVEMDENTLITYVNQAGLDLLGYTDHDIQAGLKGLDLLHPDDREKAVQSIADYYEDERGSPIECSVMRKDGSDIPVLLKFMPVLTDRKITGFRAVVTDIRRLKQAEERIQASLKEKKTLLQEIRHRVKNNMNVVSSLLSLHKNSTQNEEVKKALQESQGRIYTMSAVHEALYNAKNMAEIDLTDYLNKLCSWLLQTYSTNNPDKRQVLIEGDDVKLGIEKAFPVGLTVNEMLSNALKYAFPDVQNGEIRIKLALSGTWLEMIVQDNGIGMPDGLDWRNSNSLGLRLIRSLIENQLDGSIEMNNTNGTRFTLHFNTED